MTTYHSILCKETAGELFGRMRQNMFPTPGKRQEEDAQGTQISKLDSFIDILNLDVEVKDLWSFFKVYGRVRDVFLSAKNSQRRSSFAFVRFGSLEEANMVANSANGRHVCRWPVVSKLAAVGWKNRRVLMLSQGAWRTVNCEETGRESGYCSFVEVVKEGDSRKLKGESKREENMASMPWSRPKEVDEWVSRCAVGIFREFSHVKTVNQRLDSCGFRFYSSYLGDKSILWVFESECKREGFIKNSLFWNDCFCSMTRWCDSLRAK
ncbi:hypothetical protein Ddye_014626 [Dipteronia dyeriana]|uniref:RRM domain-containing protein n=1 Tax=Dipteronia dyeriana TaxID=168575 RepID=A0AAD9X8M0_9ROSI|nr:hypothetical protein Ddye_014626 [Dipteronia dyeriana]